MRLQRLRDRQEFEASKAENGNHLSLGGGYKKEVVPK